MTTNTKTNALEQQAADQSLIDGFTKHASTIPASLLIGGIQIQTTTIITTLQTRIAARAAVAPGTGTGGRACGDPGDGRDEVLVTPAHAVAA